MVESTSPYNRLPVKYPPLRPQALEKFLAGKWLARLATVSGDGEPHVKPVLYLWTGNEFWIMTWLKCKTVRNIKYNNRVALAIDVGGEPVTDFSHIGCLVHGIAELVPEIKDRIEPSSWHFKIFAKYFGEKACYEPPISRHLSNSDMAIRISPRKILSWDLTQSTSANEEATD